VTAGGAGGEGGEGVWSEDLRASLVHASASTRDARRHARRTSYGLRDIDEEPLVTVIVPSAVIVHVWCTFEIR
jgi:hypothetical protein